MQLSKLKFAALLSYSPRGDSPEIQKSKRIMTALKSDEFIKAGTPRTTISEWVAETIKRKKDEMPFNSFFQPTTILVPTPKSTLMRPDTLWVPDRLAGALVDMGLGSEVARCLKRIKAVPKAALSEPKERPTATQHYETMSIQGSLSQPDEIVLIDDIVTRGATLLGAANRLVDAFPGTRIRAFAAMRTISNPVEFESWLRPCVGTIELRESGDTLRRP